MKMCSTSVIAMSPSVRTRTATRRSSSASGLPDAPGASILADAGAGLVVLEREAPRGELGAYAGRRHARRVDEEVAVDGGVGDEHRQGGAGPVQPGAAFEHREVDAGRVLANRHARSGAQPQPARGVAVADREHRGAPGGADLGDVGARGTREQRLPAGGILDGDVAAGDERGELERERPERGPGRGVDDGGDVWMLQRLRWAAAREQERGENLAFHLEPPTWMRATVTVWPTANSRYGRTWRASVGLPSSRITTTSPRASEKFERPAPK